MAKTPSKNEILSKAIQLFHTDRAKHGDPAFDITPTEDELKENGYFAQAASELMRDNARAVLSEWENYDCAVRSAEAGEPKPNFEDSEDSQKQDDFFDVSLALRSGFCIFGNSGCGKTNLAKLIIGRLVEHGALVYVFDASKQYEDLGFDVVTVSSGKTHYAWLGNTVFDLSSLPIWEKVSFVDSVCAALLSEREFNQMEFLIFEEAQTYLPNNAFRNLKLYGNILRLMSIGRNFNIHFGLVSQFPSYVEKFFVRNAQQKFFGYLYEPNDFRYMKQILSKEWVQKLKSLDVGEFLYQHRDKITKIKVPLYSERQTINEQNSITFSYACQVV